VKLTFPTIDHATAIIVVIVVIYLVIALWLIWKQNVSRWSVVIATYVVSFLVLVLWWVPKVQLSSLLTKGVKAEDVFKAENDARTTLAQIIGGFAVLTGLYFAWRNITVTKEGQITDRFYKAIEQLGTTDDKGNPKLELRLGGIYAMERIARDSERDHWPIMEVLTAYVREHAPTHLPANQTNPVAQDPAPLATDIQAIVTVIRRREWSYENPWQYLDLHQADLSGVNLTGAHLRGVNLVGADLAGAHLEFTNLTGANLMCTDLKDAQGVTQDQIDLAIGDATTKLPAGIVMPESWKKRAS
jgi:hypothetical protein